MKCWTGVWALGILAIPLTCFGAWFEDVAPGLSEPLADPWAARFQTTFFGSTAGSRIYRMNLGAQVGVLQTPEMGSWEGRAAVFSRFDGRSQSFNLQTADFLGGIAWRKNWAGGESETSLVHFSSHGSNDEVSLTPTPNISREIARVLFRLSRERWTVYAGPRCVVRSDPEWMAGKFGLQSGTQYVCHPFFLGVDLLFRGEYPDSAESCLFLGVSLSPAQARFQQVFHLIATTGHALSGQWESQPETMLGLGMIVLDLGPR